MTARSAADRARGQGAGLGVILAGALGCSVLALVLVATLGALGGASLGASRVDASAGSGYGVSAIALKEIPPLYLRLYEQAAQRYGLDWAILAGIGKVECDHGRDPAPSCTQEGVVNSAGAGGPMQFLASTWAQYGVNADGDGRHRPVGSSRCDLRRRQLPARLWRPRQLRARRSSPTTTPSWYVAEVEQWAARYSGPGGSLRIGDRAGRARRRKARRAQTQPRGETLHARALHRRRTRGAHAW